MFVPKIEFVGSVEFVILTFLWRKRKLRHYDVITNFIFIEFKYKSAKSSYLSGIPTFSLIRYKRVEIYSWEVNLKYYVESLYSKKLIKYSIT